MPEGFKSIADMQVVIDANTEKLTVGMEAARNIVAKFAEEGSGQLTIFDKAAGAITTTLAGFQTRLGVVGLALGQVSAVLETAKAGMEKIATETGTEENFKKVEGAATRLQDAMVGQLSGALKSTASEFAATTFKVLGFTEAQEGATVTSTVVAAAMQDRLAAALNETAFQFERLAPISKQSLSTLQEDLERTERRVADLRAEAASGPVASEIFINPGAEAFGAAGYAESRERSAEALRKEADQMEAYIPAAKMFMGLEKLRAQAEAERLGDEAHQRELELADTTLESLDKEIEGLEQKVKMLGMSATAMATYNAELRIRKALEAQDEDLADNPAVEAKLQERLAKYAELNGKIEVYRLNERAAGAIAGMDNEIRSLQRRAETLDQNGAAAARAAAEERALDAIRRLGREPTDQQIDDIVDRGDEIERETRLIEERTAAKKADRVVSNLGEEVAEIERRTHALSMSAEQSAYLLTVEKALAQIRRETNREPTADERGRVESEARRKGAATLELNASLRQMQEFKQAGLVVTNELDKAFQNFARSGELNIKAMVASMLQDMAMLVWKQNVTSPLLKVLTGEGQNGGGLLGSISDALFSGFRATGGDVIAGPRDPSSSHLERHRRRGQRPHRSHAVCCRWRG